MHRYAVEWRRGGGISPSVFSKVGQWDRRCLFIIGVAAGKILGGRMIFSRISPKLPEKFFVQLLPTKFLPQRSLKTLFWCDLQKRSSCVFLQTFGAIFWSQATFGGILTQIFSKSNLWGCACAHCTSTSNTTAFHNSVIGNFVVYQNRLEKNLLQLLRHLVNSEWFSIIYVIIFEVNIVDQQKQTIGNDFFVFISFHCPQLFCCSPCLTTAPASLNMHVVSSNFAKTVFASVNMTSCCDIINNVYPVTLTTIHHCTILEFGRGASKEAVAPGITRPLHATGHSPFV